MPKIILAEMPRECGFNFSKCFVGGFEKMLVGKKKMDGRMLHQRIKSFLPLTIIIYHQNQNVYKT